MMKTRLPSFMKFVECLELPLICLLASLLFSCKGTAGASLKPQTGEYLGTVCTINAFEDGSKQLYESLFARLAEIDARFSVNRTDSEISAVNSQAGVKPVAVSSDVFYVISQALVFAGKSGAAFDPTVGPLVKLWGINTEHAKVPSVQELDAVLPLIDWNRVLLDETANTVFLEKPGMALDLGGIAKGYAADEMIRILKANGVKRAVVNLGGNVSILGKKKDKSSWKVGIKNPEDAGDTIVLALSLESSCNVVTSGPYERYFVQDGHRYHHILNTKSGFPSETSYRGRQIVSTTIIDESSCRADALSTIAFIMGPAEFRRAFQTVSVVFIDDSGTVYASPDLDGKLELFTGSGEVEYF